MGKFLIVLVIVAIIGFVFYARTSPRPPEVLSNPQVAPSTQPPRPVPPSDLPLRARVEQVCAQDKVELLFYQELPGDILEIRVRGGSLQEVSQVLDDLRLAGIMKDLFDDQVRYSQIFVLNKFMHEATYKIRTR